MSTFVSSICGDDLASVTSQGTSSASSSLSPSSLTAKSALPRCPSHRRGPRHRSSSSSSSVDVDVSNGDTSRTGGGSHRRSKDSNKDGAASSSPGPPARQAARRDGGSTNGGASAAAAAAAAATAVAGDRCGGRGRLLCGKLTSHALRDIAVYNPMLASERGGGDTPRMASAISVESGGGRRKGGRRSARLAELSDETAGKERPPNDYFVANVIRIAKGTASQFASTWVGKVKAPPLTNDCCQTYSTLSCALLGCLENSIALRCVSTTSAQNYMLFVSSWLHQLTQPLWALPSAPHICGPLAPPSSSRRSGSNNGNTNTTSSSSSSSSAMKARPTVADVIRVLKIHEFFHIRSEPFLAVLYSQRERAVELLHGLLDTRLVAHELMSASSSSSKSGTNRAVKLCGYVIVSGDYAFAVAAVPHIRASRNPTREPRAWTLCLCDSHGALPWAADAVCTTRVSIAADASPTRGAAAAKAAATAADGADDRGGCLPLEDGLRHFSNILFALLEDCRARHFGAPGTSAEAAAAGVAPRASGDDGRSLNSRGPVTRSRTRAHRESTVAPLPLDLEASDDASTADTAALCGTDDAQLPAKQQQQQQQKGAALRYMTWTPIVRDEGAKVFSKDELGCMMHSSWLPAVLAQAPTVVQETRRYNFTIPSLPFFDTTAPGAACSSPHATADGGRASSGSGGNSDRSGVGDPRCKGAAAGPHEATAHTRPQGSDAAAAVVVGGNKPCSEGRSVHSAADVRLRQDRHHASPPPSPPRRRRRNDDAAPLASTSPAQPPQREKVQTRLVFSAGGGPSPPQALVPVRQLGLARVQRKPACATVATASAAAAPASLHPDAPSAGGRAADAPPAPPRSATHFSDGATGDPPPALLLPCRIGRSPLPSSRVTGAPSTPRK